MREGAECGDQHWQRAAPRTSSCSPATLHPTTSGFQTPPAPPLPSKTTSNSPPRLQPPPSKPLPRAQRRPAASPLREHRLQVANGPEGKGRHRCSRRRQRRRRRRALAII